jgi:hypothetical protein
MKAISSIVFSLDYSKKNCVNCAKIRIETTKLLWYSIIKNVIVVRQTISRLNKNLSGKEFIFLLFSQFSQGQSFTNKILIPLFCRLA